MKNRHYNFTIIETENGYDLKLVYKGFLFYRKRTVHTSIKSKPQLNAVLEVLEAVKDFTVYKKYLKKLLTSK